MSYRMFQNICSIIIIAACLSSLIRVGYSIFPIIIIPLQIFVLIINNRKNGNIQFIKRRFK
jgi:hypothetical protein